LEKIFCALGIKVCALENLFCALEIKLCALEIKVSNAQTRVRSTTLMSRRAQKTGRTFGVRPVGPD
jgi:hypothetical protein